MKKIKMLNSNISGVSGQLEKGQVYEVEDDKADALVRSGDAVVVGVGAQKSSKKKASKKKVSKKTKKVK